MGSSVWHCAWPHPKSCKDPAPFSIGTTVALIQAQQTDCRLHHHHHHHQVSHHQTSERRRLSNHVGTDGRLWSLSLASTYDHVGESIDGPHVHYSPFASAEADPGTKHENQQRDSQYGQYQHQHQQSEQHGPYVGSHQYHTAADILEKVRRGGRWWVWKDMSPDQLLARILSRGMTAEKHRWRRVGRPTD